MNKGPFYVALFEVFQESFRLVKSIFPHKFLLILKILRYMAFL